MEMVNKARKLKHNSSGRVCYLNKLIHRGYLFNTILISFNNVFFCINIDSLLNNIHQNSFQSLVCLIFVVHAVEIIMIQE